MKTKMIFNREDIKSRMQAHMATKGYRVVDFALTKDDGECIYSNEMEITVEVEKMDNES